MVSTTMFCVVAIGRIGGNTVVGVFVVATGRKGGRSTVVETRVVDASMVVDVSATEVSGRTPAVSTVVEVVVSTIVVEVSTLVDGSTEVVVSTYVAGTTLVDVVVVGGIDSVVVDVSVGTCSITRSSKVGPYQPAQNPRSIPEMLIVNS